ncbi:hypothetical protein GOP47_0022017 [Adiantum capillus-veneris]|uniref:Uncharacterized protein n=1 Tax=Adiantum capillus-veneris TaxID=13818 RepID=A0A9D4U8T3_ADICA|nr:hypothetical protein GOP47_0022017 [Adiantum capillus-veneris]
MHPKLTKTTKTATSIYSKMSIRDFEKQLNMGYNPFQDMYDNSKPYGHASRFEFNIKLTFVDVNVFGAKISRDPMNRYLVKVEDLPTPTYPSVLVSNMGDHYVYQDGVLYVITSDPQNTDKLGSVISNGHATMDEPTWTRKGQVSFQLI